jgi:carbonic anhydrase
MAFFLKGPSTWGSSYAQAAGKHQSPIDIVPDQTTYDPDLVESPLSFNFNRECFTVLKNTGHSFTVSGSPDAKSSKICQILNKKLLCGFMLKI